MSEEAARSMPKSVLSRRDFVCTSVAGVAAASVGLVPGMDGAVRSAAAATIADPRRSAEWSAAQLLQSLTSAQREALVFGADDERRGLIAPDWCITGRRLGDVLDGAQLARVQEILVRLHSPAHAGAVLAQLADDHYPDGLRRCSIAFFGPFEPPATADDEAPQYEFVLTGRHVTRRCGCPPGGPVAYGGDPQAASFAFGRQHQVGGALLSTLRRLHERSRQRRRRPGGLTAAAPRPEVWEIRLSPRMKRRVGPVLATMLAPLRREQAARTRAALGAAAARPWALTYYRDVSLSDDEVWDACRVACPAMTCYWQCGPRFYTWMQPGGAA